MKPRFRLPALAAFAAASALVLTACGGGSSDTPGGSGGSGDGPKLSLVAYAVPQPAFDQLIPGFQATPEGKGVTFSPSYGASGDQSRKVDSGAPADVVNFSVEPDVTRLVKSGKVDAAWNQNATGGVPFGSVVSIVVRKGNPKNIHDWADLLQPGLEVISPNPLSSGSAKWNLLAPYAAASEGGKNPQAGLDFVSKLVADHIKARPGSGRDATDLFLQGQGDVLISYENEAINSERSGANIEHFIPPTTFKIENPVAVLKGSANLAKANDFVNYLYTSDGQTRFAKAGFRPVDPAVTQQFAGDFPTPKQLWTIKDLGGWTTVDKDLFDKDNGSISKIYTAATG